MSARTPILAPTFALAAALAVAAGDPARAGFLTVEADKGSTVKIWYDTNGDGTGETEAELADTGGNGKVTFGLGSLEAEKKIGTVTVRKVVDGTPQYGEVKLDEGGNTLASLEPFDFPGFAAPITVVASIDMVALLSQGNPFFVGQVLNVVNGTIAGSSAVVFKDGSSLPDDPDVSRSLVASLPNYSGPAVVSGFDAARPAAAVPEPASAALAVLAGAGLAARAVRRRAPAGG